MSTETQNSSMGAFLHVGNETVFDVCFVVPPPRNMAVGTYFFLFLGN